MYNVNLVTYYFCVKALFILNGLVSEDRQEYTTLYKDDGSSGGDIEVVT